MIRPYQENQTNFLCLFHLVMSLCHVKYVGLCCRIIPILTVLFLGKNSNESEIMTDTLPNFFCEFILTAVTCFKVSPLSLQDLFLSGYKAVLILSNAFYTQTLPKHCIFIIPRRFLEVDVFCQLHHKNKACLLHCIRTCLHQNK